MPEPEPRVTVVQALPKGDRGELAVEVLTEVGVATVVPWAAARSVAVWRGERADEVAGPLAGHRARGRQAVAARVVPQVEPMATTDQVVRPRRLRPTWRSCSTRTPTPSLASLDVPGAGSVVVVVGPEGGLTDDEVAAFAAAGASRRTPG